MPGEPPQFRYMQSPRLARWIDAPCKCGAAPPNLDGAHFEGTDVRQAVCLACLVAGKVSRDLFSRQKALEDHLRARQKAWGTAKIHRVAEEKIAELAKTPPVPWLRENEWPICCEDFAVYRGEWAQKDWARAAKDGNGQAALERVLGNKNEAAEIFKDLPKEATEKSRVAAFVFRCATCQKHLVVAQRR